MTSFNPRPGKTILITGATSGIGLEAARRFAADGYFVIGCGRSVQRCREARERLLTQVPGVRIEYLTADLSSLAQVARLADEVRQTLREAGRPHLDVLLNNAGCYSARYIQSADGYELTFAVNHLAPFSLTRSLLPLIQAAPSGRVITVSSDSHVNTWLDLSTVTHPWPYIGLWAYKVSKLANVLFTRALDRRLVGTPARAFAVDPGLVRTDIGLKNAGPFSRLVWKMRQSRAVEPEVPVRTIHFLAGDPGVQTDPHPYWYDSRPKMPSGLALQTGLAEALWEASLSWCGCEPSTPNA